MATKKGREITLISNDGLKYVVSPGVAKMSRLWANNLKDYKGLKSFKLDKLNGQTLEHIIKWTKHAKGTWTGRTDTTPWEEQFASQIERDDIFKLVVAANDLQIDGLKQLMCKCIAKMISGKTPEQMKAEFGIVSDLTPEEEKQIRWENELVVEKLLGDEAFEGKDAPAIAGGSKGKVAKGKEPSGSGTGKKDDGAASGNVSSSSYFEPSTICRCRNCFLYYRNRGP